MLYTLIQNLYTLLPPPPIHALLINYLDLHGILVHTELAFLETSALTGENVEEVFLKCTRTILTKIDGGM